MNIPRHLIEHGILGVGGFGPNSLTVGTGGRFSSMQAALDYVATQPAFIAVSPSTNGTVTSWAFGSDEITLGTAPVFTGGTTIGIGGRYWISLSGDNFYYPIDGSFASNTKLIASMRRLDASLVAVTKAIYWWRENTFKIVLLDSYVAESPTINADCSIIITSIGRCWWNGAIFKGVNFKSGTVHLVGIDQSISSLAWSVASAIRLRFDQVRVIAIGPDGYSPGGICGSVEFYDGVFEHSPNASRGHIFNLKTAGDMVIKNSVWNCNNASASGVGVLSNSYLTDRIDSRRLVLDGIRANVFDRSGHFSSVAFIGDDFGGGFVGANNVLLNDLSMWFVDSTAQTPVSELSIMRMGAGWTKGVIEINRCSILAPRGTQNKKLVSATSILGQGGASGGPVTINIGKSNDSLPYDAAAGVTYNVL